MGSAAEIDAIARTTSRLAVLLSAGVAPGTAWSYLADGASDPVLTAAARAAACGENVSTAIVRATGRSEEWGALAAAWFVAVESGAPLAQCLRDLAEGFRSLGEARRELTVSLAGPRATARMVMALPLVGVLFGAALGFNTLETLFATGPGLGCLFAGGALLCFGALWNRALLRRAAPTELAPGLTIDLMAVAMSGGASADRAWALVERARERYGLTDDAAAVAPVIGLSVRAGVPAAELLRGEAEEARRGARAAARVAASRLAVRLMLPLGVCVLPAFMLLGVAPLLVAILSSTLGAL
jgi:tight adherence protein B